MSEITACPFGRTVCSIGEVRCMMWNEGRKSCTMNDAVEVVLKIGWERECGKKIPEVAIKRGRKKKVEAKPIEKKAPGRKKRGNK